MSDAPSAQWWLDETQPLDPERSEAQIAGVLRLLAPPPRRVLDLGCGTGRVLVPLAAAGHDVVGIDHQPSALDACRQRLAEGRCRGGLIAADFRKPWPEALDVFDAVCCLGNTFMLLADVDEAVTFLQRAAGCLSSHGMLLIDDFPHEFWAELTEGRWQSGLSEDGKLQMVWEPGDAVFALRSGDRIDPDDWRPGSGDRRLRLWSAGALHLAARLAGLSAPEHRPRDGLLILHRLASGAGG